MNRGAKTSPSVSPVTILTDGLLLDEIQVGRMCQPILLNKGAKTYCIPLWQLPSILSFALHTQRLVDQVAPSPSHEGGIQPSCAIDGTYTDQYRPLKMSWLAKDNGCDKT